jgi:hypothetical protein
MLVLFLTIIYLFLISWIIITIFVNALYFRFNFIRKIHELRFNKIEDAVRYILKIKNINTRKQLYNFTNKKLYSEVEKIAPDAWYNATDPKTSVRFAYQKCLSGYSLYK